MWRRPTSEGLQLSLILVFQGEDPELDPKQVKPLLPELGKHRTKRCNNSFLSFRNTIKEKVFLIKCLND